MANPIDVESIDLADLATRLCEVSGPVVTGLVVGRTQLRDVVVELLGCSELEAENLVETMIGRGFIVRRSRGRSDDLVEWHIVRDGR